ncbi:Cys-Gln thioester bond-forming surface protein [Yinghuangia seranimata]|uniref:Cys-Gln thioester bond-forming surface protein n=1 Tax=Yinghuangia seranimata TaxID=408067 RepID=UPI00248C1FAE|nr:Cys-Gln thioester bond-forming surface protein [Yinghuangia seranimata]MDI2124951.1 Cys-Gln thioester bond-forming surface protein [Yinghuangia seranimata]
MLGTMRGMRRCGTALAVPAAAVAALLFTSGTAAADTGTTAKYDGTVDETRSSVWVKVPVEGRPGVSEWHHPVTALMQLKADGGAVKVYCIDRATVVRPSSEYREASWSDSWLSDSERTRKITWVLNNSYPKIDDLDKVAGQAGIAKGGLDVREAVAATQAAVWHFSNGAQLPDTDNQGARQSGDVLKLYTYLTGAGNTGLNEPKPSLTLDPEKAQGTPGDKPIGPLKVTTNAVGKVSVKVKGTAPQGVSLVGKDGKPVTEAANGTELYAKVPAGTPAGSLEVTAQTTAAVGIGRVFVGKDRKDTQTLIAAGPSEVNANASGSFVWAPKPKPVPHAAAAVDCAEGGLVVSLTNTGGAPADFRIGDTTVTVPAGGSKKHTVKVAEDADYSVTVTGPDGFSETFAGKRDCQTPPPVVNEPVPNPDLPAEPLDGHPTTPVPATPGPEATPHLAQTGGSDSATTLIGSIAGALLLAGGGAVFLVRRRKSAGNAS